MIQIMDVKKSFGAEEVLHGITREFEPGKIHGIVGNNGSGKTVLMKCICGFLRPTSGRVLVDGKEVGKDMDFPENLGAIIETPGFLPNLTGLKNLKLLASLRGKIGFPTGNGVRIGKRGFVHQRNIRLAVENLFNIRIAAGHRNAGVA